MSQVISSTVVMVRDNIEKFAHMVEELSQSADKFDIDNQDAAYVMEQWAEALREDQVVSGNGLPDLDCTDPKQATQD